MNALALDGNMFRMKFTTQNALLLSLGLLGCSGSQAVELDAGIEFDATPDATADALDAAADAEADVAGDDATLPRAGDWGDPCLADDDCDELCVVDDGGRGRCALRCFDDADCPINGTCSSLGRGSEELPGGFCLTTCSPEASVRQCPAGYGCGMRSRGRGTPCEAGCTSDADCAGAATCNLSGFCCEVDVFLVCRPGCTDDTDCVDAAVCDPAAGQAGACFAVGAALGDACESTDECTSGGNCLAEEATGWPSGTCVDECDPEMNCPEGTTCVATNGMGLGAGRCDVSCTDDSDCREAYRCELAQWTADTHICRPGCGSDLDCSAGRTCYPFDGTCGPP